LLCKSKNKPSLNCIVCNQLSANFLEWEQHVTSESHVERVKVFRPPASSLPFIAPSSSSLSPAINDNHIEQNVLVPGTNNIPSLLPPQELKEIQEKFQEKLNQKALQQILAKDKQEWRCHHCQITCQSLCSWEAHLSSKKHRKNKHKFHTYPGISKTKVENQYRNRSVNF
jgi:hypothetical protein